MFFIPQLAVFPIHYLDKDICVFEFPPLDSKISVRKTAPGSSLIHAFEKEE